MSTKSDVKDTALYELFLDQLQDINWAENKLVKTLPKMKEAATADELAEAFAGHLKETETHVKRLEKAFGLLDEDVDSKKCEAMAGLVKEGEELIDETEEGTEVRDVALIMAAQKVEHYEIASYGSIITIAKQLGFDNVAKVLHDTLKEEKGADEKLTKIAESSINKEAKEEK